MPGLVALEEEIVACNRCPRVVEWRERVAIEKRAAVRCAPPANQPTPAERDACEPWLLGELAQLKHVCTVLCLGG